MEIKTPIYLDYNATSPCDPRVVEAMLPYFSIHFGNAASRDHAFGWMANDAVELAREQVATLIGAKAKQITFTSGATEAINLAIKGTAEANETKGKHIVTSKVEHKAVLDTCAYLEAKGFRVSYLDVDRDGYINLEKLEGAITDETIMVALMYANNETGVINPVKAIGDITRRHQIPFICDATQAVGKVPIEVEREGIDMLAFSAHKLYGPKGVGALYVRKGEPKVNLMPQQHGGQHEKGNRSGTLNTPAIVGFGKAASLCMQLMQEDQERLKKMRDQLEKDLLETIPGSRRNGGEERLAHVTNLYFPQVEGERLLLSLSKHLAASRGSACSGNTQRPSHVLLAMGLSAKDANHSIRISLGRFTTADEIKYALFRIKESMELAAIMHN